MRINFDELPSFASTISPQKRTVHSSVSPIKVQIQSPVYNQIIKDVNPHNYQAEISGLNQIIQIPMEVSRFIEKQIQKEIANQTKNVDAGKINNSSVKANNEIKTINQVKMNNQAKINNQIKINKQTIKTQTNKIGKLFSNDIKINKLLKQHLINNRKSKINTKKTHIHTHNHVFKNRNTKQNINYNKKHKCENSWLPTQARNVLDDVSELTCRPVLYPSATSTKIQNIRKIHRTESSATIFEDLYTDSIYRKYKSNLNQTLNMTNFSNRKPQINQKFYQTSKVTYIPLHSRLNQILENRQTKRRQKQSLDLTSGSQMFKIDLSLSQQSYKVYRQSLSKSKIVFKKKQKKVDLVYKKMRQTERKQVKKLKDSAIDGKTIQYFTSIFYPQKQQQTSLASSSVSNPLNKSQFLILHSFMNEIQQLESRKYEMETTVSSVRASGSPSKMGNVLLKEDFEKKLRKFYQGLNMHDRQILRKQIIQRKHAQMKKHKQVPEPIKTYRPSINVRSASLDSLSKGHEKVLYYI